MTDLDALLEHVTEDLLRDAAHAVTDIPSPTGREARLAAGFHAQPQDLDGFHANSVGQLTGTGAAVIRP